MEIRWLGESCFVMVEGKTRVLVDCLKEMAGELTENDIVLMTEAELESKKATVFDWPGEFETKNVLIHSIPYFEEAVEKRMLSFEIEGVRIACLGSLSAMPTEEQISELGNVDVLVLPLSLKPKECLDLVEEIDPRMVLIPQIIDEKLGDFFKIIGQPNLEAEQKIVVKNRASLDSESAVYKLLAKVA